MAGSNKQIGGQRITDADPLQVSSVQSSKTPPGTTVVNALAPTGSAAQALAAVATRAAVTLFNNGSTIVYLGIDNTLTTSNGFPLLPGAAFTVESSTAIWMITASGTGDVRYWSERY